MRNLIHFLIRHFFVIFFLALEVTALSLVVRFNHFQRARFINSSNYVVGNLYQVRSSLTGFFQLQKVNHQLSEENAFLKEKLLAVQQKLDNDTSTIAVSRIINQDSATNADSIYGKRLNPGFIQLLEQLEQDSIRFRITSAKIINNSVASQFNYITINKGSDDAIAPNMAVINSQGIVGVITDVSRHFATGPSLLNRKWKVSARIKHSRYFGSLSWDGLDYRLAQLNEIPFHVRLNKGDTIVTSGYSEIFPEGIPVGIIQDYTHPGGANFYRITVRLLTNFRTLDHVQVIRNNREKELKQLEDQNDNG